MEKIINTSKWLITIIGGVASTLLGGNDSLLLLLILMACSDMLFGGAKGFKKKEFSSSIFFWGIINKAMMFMIIAIMVQVDNVLGKFGILRNSFIIWFCLCESASMIENTAFLGIAWPDGLLSALVQVRKGFSINISKIVKQIIDNYNLPKGDNE